MTHTTNPADDYASYLIRLWRENSAEPDSPWQARIESIQTGRSWHFSNPEELLGFFERWFQPGDDATEA